MLDPSNASIISVFFALGPCPCAMETASVGHTLLWLPREIQFCAVNAVRERSQLRKAVALWVVEIRQSHV